MKESIMTQTQKNKSNAEEDNFNHPYRYFNTIVLIITALFNSMFVQIFSTVTHELDEYFPEVSITEISLCALAFMITHPWISFLANYVLDTYSLKLGVSIGSILVIVGVCVKLLIVKNFAWMIVGSFIIALGNIYVLNIPSKYSAVWFEPQKRIFITTFLIFANSISGGLGAVVSPIFIKKDLPPDEGRQQVINYVYYQTAVFAGVMVLNLIFFRGSPSKNDKCCPKNILQKKNTGVPYSKNLKNLFKSKEYLLLLFAMMFTLAVLNCFASFLQLYIIPFGLDSTDAAIATGVSVLTGLTGAIISGMIIKKNHQYKKVLKIQYVLSMVTVLIFMLSLIFQIKPLFWICTALCGFSFYPLLPALMEYACEKLYPIGQASVAGFMFAGGQLASFFTGLAQSFLLAEKTKLGVFYTAIINITFLAISLVLVSCSKNELKRLNAKKNEEESDEEGQLNK